MSKRHHVVSRGYLRQFAAGEQIRLIWKDLTRTKVVGTRDVFVEAHFNSAKTDHGLDDELEDEWARLERQAIPAMRRAIDGQIDEDVEVALKVLASLHFSRSYHHRQVFERVFENTAENIEERTDRLFGEVQSNPTFREAAIQFFGRLPDRSDIAALVAERVDALKNEGQFFVERMVAIHNKTLLEWLQPLHLQIIRPYARTLGFVTSDNPIVVTDKHWSHLGLALGDATFFYMPLGRHTAMMFTTKDEGHVTVDNVLVQRLNHLMRRNCFRQIACHPDDPWKRCLAVS